MKIGSEMEKQNKNRYVKISTVFFVMFFKNIRDLKSFYKSKISMVGTVGYH